MNSNINTQPKVAKKLTLKKESIHHLTVEPVTSAWFTPTRDGC
jgi:hypothetical protein